MSQMSRRSFLATGAAAATVTSVPGKLAALESIQRTVQPQVGVSRFQQREKLAIQRLDLLTTKPTSWKRVDIRIALTGTYRSPFDPDEIAVDALIRTPSGEAITLPAFFYQQYERQVRAKIQWPTSEWDGTAREILEPVDRPDWRIRLMPTERGTYSVRVRARDRSGEVTSEPMTFTAESARGHGFIRVSQKDPRYFEFDDGTPYFAIGQNVVEGPLSEYYRWLPEMARFGANYSRLWIGFPYFALELGTLGEYRLDNAWRTDQVIELSENIGIYQKICIDWVWFIVPSGVEHEGGFYLDDYPYSVSNGGPCQNMRDFFARPEARRWFRNRLRYIVARWAYSSHVMAWELWNEIDLVEPARRGDKTLIPEWNREMARYLKSIDPYQHLTTNSVAHRWPELWKLPENEFAQKHGYYFDTKEQEELGKDMANYTMRWLDDVADYGKPYYFAEYGIKDSEVRNQDRDGVHVHNPNWASLAYGAAGTANVWWWYSYMEPKNLYWQFRGVARFVEDIPFTTAGFVRAEIETNQENLRAIGLRGKPLSIVWIQNKLHTWYNVINQRPIPAVENGEVTLSGFQSGSYRIEYWDTYEGRITKTITGRAVQSALRIAVPALDRDIAMKIFPR
ncbi:MAG: DUF5060 domain-containing protein [Luteitalea sp.]|nr:DUF5060 domain-containing protein [Luteitalea sp.]